MKEQLRAAGTGIDAKIRKTERDIAAAKEDERTKYVEYREGIITQSEYVAYKMRQEGRLNDFNRQKAELEAGGRTWTLYQGNILRRPVPCSG